MLSFNRLLRVARARLGRALVGALESMADALRDAPPRARAALLALAWPSLLGALGLLLSKATHGTLIASLCVDTLVSLIATCASVGETASAPRDALVNALVKCADEEGLRKCAQVFFSSKKITKKKKGPQRDRLFVRWVCCERQELLKVLERLLGMPCWVCWCE
jgi:hypothetical protein